MDVYASLFHNCGDAVVIANHQSEIVFANAAAQTLFKNDFSALLAQPETPILSLLETDATSKTSRTRFPLQEVLLGTKFCGREFLLRSSRVDEGVWLSITGYPVCVAEGAAPGGMLIIRDVTQQKEDAQVQLRSTFRDELTGLVNRNVFMDRVDHALTRARRDEAKFIAIFCLDLRRLKAVNDTFGYIAGDELLVAVTERINQVLKPEDTLSRLGGDEFTILVEDVTSISAAGAIADSIHEALLCPFQIQGHSISVDVSLGISLGDHTCRDAGTLLRQADIAMHQARNAFDERYCVFETSMRTNLDNSLHLEMELKKAIENHELFLEYQPIFLVRSQEVIGVESLVRWQHPQRGLLPPSKFISLAEKTGLIVPLGWWVLEESCRQLKVWQETIPKAKSLFVSVNMSSKQFSQKNIPDKIADILRSMDLSPRSLRIEMTEGVLIDNSASIIEVLEAIRSMGIKLSIDDFGTGYSSLSYLHKFPFDTLKIDRSFLENADSDFEKLEILQSMVRLAWNLGLEVVAEGIETQKHFAQIKALRCESGQGFLFSKPLGYREMEALLLR